MQGPRGVVGDCVALVEEEQVSAISEQRLRSSPCEIPVNGSASPQNVRSQAYQTAHTGAYARQISEQGAGCIENTVTDLSSSLGLY